MLKKLQFSTFRSSCEENHFTYPPLHSDNPVKLCNMSLGTGEDMWVGVYRQRLNMTNLGKTGNLTCETEYQRVVGFMMI